MHQVRALINEPVTIVTEPVTVIKIVLVEYILYLLQHRILTFALLLKQTHYSRLEGTQ